MAAYHELSVPSRERTHKVLGPAFAGYELAACRGFFGLFVPCLARNLWQSPIFEQEFYDADNFEICCWPGSEFAWTEAQQRRGTYSLRVKGNGIYLLHEVVADHLVPVDGTRYVDPFSLGRTAEAVSENAHCSWAFTFSLDIRAPMGTLWQLAVHKNDMGKTLVAVKDFSATGFWQRDGVHLHFMVDGPGQYLLSIRRHPDCPAADDFCWYVDGPNIILGKHNAKFVTGDPDRWFLGDQGLRWLGVPQASFSERDWWTHQGGELVYLKDFGFRTVGHQGLGEAPRQHVTSPFALRPGTYHQRQRLRHREFTIQGQFTTDNLFELHQRRQWLIMLMNKFFTDDESPVRMRYQLSSDQGLPIGRELLIDCRYVAGAGGNIASDYGEELSLSFVADSPTIFEEGEVVARALFTDATSEWCITVTNEGDAPSPFYVFISGSGHLKGFENRTSSQRVDVDFVLPGNGYAIFAPNETNHRSKTVWTDNVTGAETGLQQYVEPGGHLPILELVPTLLCRQGYNEICFDFEVGTYLEAEVRVVSRHAFYGVDGASIPNLAMMNSSVREAWAV